MPSVPHKAMVPIVLLGAAFQARATLKTYLDIY